MKARCIHCEWHWEYLSGKKYLAPDMSVRYVPVKENEPSRYELPRLREKLSMV